MLYVRGAVRNPNPPALPAPGRRPQAAAAAA